jgi:Ca-activated chloride channel family protein
VPFFQQLSSTPLEQQRVTTRQTLPLIIATLLWLSLLMAAASPTWIGEPVTLPNEGRDLMLAVDLSESMQIEDMDVNGERSNRLIAVKAVLNDFIERRKGDRLGLILFGSQAYVQAPLTFDRDTVRQFLLEAQIGFAGGQTAIGDAIGMAVKRLRKRPGDEHVLVLLTDGANTAGAVQPLAAARFAAENNITIYTVGIGAEELVTPGLFGSSFGARRINPSADLDENTLQQIASLTGGQYFRARSPKELLSIYQLLDELEPIDDEAQTFRPIKRLYYWPLGFALVLSALGALGFAVKQRGVSRV